MVHAGSARHPDKDFTRWPRGPARSQHLPHGRLQVEGGNTVLSMLNDSAVYVRARVNHIQYGPDSLPSGIFVNTDSFWDIRITGSGVDTLTDITMRMEITNNAPTYVAGTSDITLFQLVPRLPQDFLNRIEIQPNGGTTEDTIYFDQALFDLWWRLSPEKKASMGLAFGMNTSGPNETDPAARSNQRTYDEDGLGINPGESKEFFFPVHSMLTQSRMFLPSKSQDPRIRCYAAAQPVCTDSSAFCSMQVNGVDCIISGLLYEDSVRAAMKQHYQSIPSVSRVLVHERQNLDVGSASPNVPLTDLSLTVFNGAYPFMNVTMVNNSAVGEFRYDSGRNKKDDPADALSTDPVGTNEDCWIPLERITLTDSNGNPIWYNLIPGKFLKHIVAGYQFDESYIHGEKNVYPLIFSTDAMETLETGANHGGIVMDSNFQLQVIPGRDFVPVVGRTYGLRINAWRYALMTMDTQGKFSVTKL